MDADPLGYQLPERRAQKGHIRGTAAPERAAGLQFALERMTGLEPATLTLAR